MSQAAKTCDATPIDWTKVKTEGSGDEMKISYDGAKAYTTAILHHCVTTAMLVDTLSQRLGNLHNPDVSKMLSDTSFKHVTDTLARTQPQDPLEEMLIAQCLVTHNRTMFLTRRMSETPEIDLIRSLSEAADRAANTYRRQVLALREYRRPNKTVHFIRQNNVAGQQIVSNSFSESENATNEQGLQPADISNSQPEPQATPALPADEGRVDPLAGVSRTREAVGAEHRPQDGSGQSPIADERDEAW